MLVLFFAIKYKHFFFLSLRRCSAKSYPSPTITWRHNETALQIETDPNYEQLESGDLHILKVNNDSSGVYECLAKNEHGESSNTGYMTVVSTTTIEEGPVDRTEEVRLIIN